MQPEQLRRTIARLGAHYLEQIVRPGLCICVGLGRTLVEVCKRLRPAKIPNINIVQAMGNVGHEAMDIDFNQMAHEADLYLFGVGSLTSDLIFTRTGIFKSQDLEQLQKAGSVGDICARFFDIHGVEIPSAFQERIVGITLDDLRSTALTIAVAGGTDKTEPLIGALNGHLVKVLVTDEQTAQAILDYPDERRRKGS